MTIANYSKQNRTLSIPGYFILLFNVPALTFHKEQQTVSALR